MSNIGNQSGKKSTKASKSKAIEDWDPLPKNDKQTPKITHSKSMTGEEPIFRSSQDMHENSMFSESSRNLPLRELVSVLLCKWCLTA